MFKSFSNLILTVVCSTTLAIGVGQEAQAAEVR